MREILKRLAIWFGCGLVFLQSLVTALRWWSGEITEPAGWEWLWLALFPPMLYLYLRHVSIFGCKQPTCLQPDDKENPPHG